MKTSRTDGPTGFHIPSLDGLRAVSIVLVVVAHLGLGDLVPGGFGVTVFFFLSGFLICTLLRREFEMTGTISLKKFYLRRALRIFPCMYTVLAGGVIFSLAGGFDDPVTLGGTLALGLHVANYHYMAGGTGMVPGLGVYWSLAIEEHFYLLFPAAALLLLTKCTLRTRMTWMIGVCFAVLAWRLMLVYGLGAHHERTYYGTDTRLDSILWGCILALGKNPALDVQRPPTAMVRWLGLAVGGGAIVGSLLYRDESFRESFRYSIQSMALLPVFYLAVSDSKSFPFQWLDMPAIRYMGRLSYPLYLVHFMVQRAFEEHYPDMHWLQFGAANLVVSVGLAMMLHHGIERPLAKFRHRLRV